MCSLLIYFKNDERYINRSLKSLRLEYGFPNGHQSLPPLPHCCQIVRRRGPNDNNNNDDFVVVVAVVVIIHRNNQLEPNIHKIYSYWDISPVTSVFVILYGTVHCLCNIKYTFYRIYSHAYTTCVHIQCVCVCLCIIPRARV
jgi:hypothetical protein